MADNREDYLSNLEYDWLNFLVYNFIPYSSRCYIQSRAVDSQEFQDDSNVTQAVGSATEELDLPNLIHKKSTQKIVSDIDFMATYDDVLAGMVDGAESWKDLVYVTQDYTSPLHCRLKFTKTTPVLEKFLNDGYLNGKYFIEAMSSNIRDMYSDGVHVFDNIGVSLKHNYIGEALQQDFVPCLPIECPLSVIQSLKQRLNRLEPTYQCRLQGIIEQLQELGIFIVHKPHINSMHPDIEWRFSFSFAERSLGKSFNNVQRVAYRVLKALIRCEINDNLHNDEEHLQTYLLKTTLFWVCERYPIEFCVSRNISKFFLVILDTLIHFIADGFLPHYFVSQANLLDKYPVNVLTLWSRSLLYIRSNVMDVMEKFWISYQLELDGEVSWSGQFIGMLKCYKLISSIKDEISGQQCRKNVSEAKIIGSLIKHLGIQSDWKQHYPLLQDRLSYTRPWIILTTHFVLSYHEMNINIVDMIKLLQTFSLNNCVCFSCLKAQFCELLDKKRNLTFPSLAADCANMWFVRSLTSTQDKDYYINQSEALYQEALNDSHQPKDFYLKYAMYLLGNFKYEEAIRAILKWIHTQTSNQSQDEGLSWKFYISQFFINMLNEILQLKLSGQWDLKMLSGKLAYNLICSSYIKAGVLAELIMPITMLDRSYGFTHKENIETLLSSSYDCMADQYLLLQDYQKAAELYYYRKNYTILDNKFVYCIAKLLMPHNISRGDTVIS